MATSPDDTLAGDAPSDEAVRRATFEVSLVNFSGPFDVLLSLIAKHKMDVTEVALAVVTDDFIAHIRAQEEWDLSQASEFLVIAATLLDLKAARLLPRGVVDDAEDLELLEARDLLFARLLQYRAFKEVAGHLDAEWVRMGRSYPRNVALEARFAALLPELVMQVGPAELAALAAAALAPKAPPPGVDLSHLHNPVVSVREQAAHIVDRLRRSGSLSFRALTDDADGTNVVVARFLALLELYRESAVAFDQADALGELTVRWTGADEGDVTVEDDYEDGPVVPQDEPDPTGAPDPTGEQEQG
ncbi:segregation and condensation protein A [Occultella kanbiaonis]|uniref:segregation and condensation protein A n=1 Tax=Occultella kanbiaonis TaxID=2675754 RepID=UPI0012BA09C5|nr:ScpA family protein [Occultella kanbiaonis]